MSYVRYKLPFADWTQSAQTHYSLLSPYADAFLKRRKAGQTHPVHDFLFTYYSCSPAKLKQWVPSFEQHLVMESDCMDYPWLNDYWFRLEENVLSYHKERLPPHSKGLALFVAHLCENILHRPPRFGCFGLHEWAMVYKLPPEALRHKARLRLPPEDLERFVESQTLCCSHYDAYRFFTEEARPLNILNPLLESRLEMEQGGCIHANMDLYKWSLKLWPWIGSDFMAKAFLLALTGRELDMRASPYDLQAEGYAPICIETEEGRRTYQQEQQVYATSAASLRKELQAFCLRFVEFIGIEKNTATSYEG